LQQSLENLVDDALAEIPPGRVVWVALSGGLDSTLLLTLAVPLARRHGVVLRAIHVNHGLQQAAGDFEAHCRRLCASLEVPLTVAAVSVTADGKGVEAAAREARYAAFRQHVAAGDVLWLAQHADDQAETLLLAALRGSGVRGLAGMPAQREWQGIVCQRPWLEVERAALEAEAGRSGLAWRDDPTNADTQFDRNYLRHRVMVTLRERWPHAAASLGRSAAWLQEADGLLAELAAIDLAAAGGDPACLPLAPMRSLSEPRRRLLIRHALSLSGLPHPPAARLAELVQQSSLAARDRLPTLRWPGAEARIWRDRLYLMMPLTPPDPRWRVRWDGVSPLTTPWGRYTSTLRPEEDMASEATLLVTLRRGGERLRIAGRGSRDVKRLLQEAELPPWQRQRVPLVWCGERLVAVLGVAVGEGWREQ